MILGVGIDIIEVARVQGSVERFGERFLKRILLPDETAYCMLHKNPAPFIAARFAAKEAISKAFGTGIGAKLGWLDMEVVTDTHGRPALLLHGRAAARATELGVVRTHLSLTHSDASAGAVVILEADG